MALTTSPQRPEPTLVPSKPTSAAPSSLRISHVQLRNLVVCPKDQGVVWYVSESAIVEQDVRAADSVPHALAQINFTPVCLDAICLDDGNVLLVAGGQEAELFLGLYSFMSKTVTVSSSGNDDAYSNSATTFQSSEEIWKHISILSGTINNSVMLYVPPIPPATSREYFDQCDVPFMKPHPRFVVSNNDCSVKIFEVNTAREGFGRRVKVLSHTGRMRRDVQVDRYQRIGALRLAVPINHTSISPDGSTLLSCGDSSSVHLHRISPWAPGMPLKFEHIASYTLPQANMNNASLMSTLPISPYLPYAFVDGQWTVGGGPSCSCFSTAWNSDGSKFAVASQEGVVVVWDVRSGEPLPKARWETSRRDLWRPDIPQSQSSSSQVPWLPHGRIHPYATSDERAFENAGYPIVPSEPSEETLHSLYAADPTLYFDTAVHAPASGVRCVKFSKNTTGQEVLVFTEHASFVHIIDADTFEKHDIIRIPHVRPTASTSLASMRAQQAMDPDQAYHVALAVERRRISGSPFDAESLSAFHRRRIAGNPYFSGRDVSSSSSTAPHMYLEVPRMLSPNVPLSRSPEPITSTTSRDDLASYVLASEHDFHVLPPPVEGGAYRREAAQLRTFTPRSRRQPRQYNRMYTLNGTARGPQPYTMPTPSSSSALVDDDIHLVSMPSFDNEEMEQNIRETLSAHGITVLPPRSRRRAEEPTMLALSVAESIGMIPESRYPRSETSQEATTVSSTSRTEGPQTGEAEDVDVDTEVDEPISDNECSTPPPPLLPPPPPSAGSQAVPVHSHGPPAVQPLPPCQDLIESTDRLDIGGVAFDPSGTCMYVATVDGISEWPIKGSKTRWWSKGGWL